MEAENRSYATWKEQLDLWWSEQWQCHGLVSDGAKALMKLADSGLASVNIADLFHALRNLGRPLGRAIGRRVSQLNRQCRQLQEKLNQSTCEKKRQTLKTKLEKFEQQQQKVADDQQTYRNALQTISLMTHPFTLDTQQWQLAEALNTSLASPLQALKALAPSYGAQAVQQAITTFETQIPSLSQGIHAWWRWVTQALSLITPDINQQNWVLMALLPWVYWSQQAEKTRRPHLKFRYHKAASEAYDHLMAHSLTLGLEPCELQKWVHWAQWMCSQYQRTSSPVEGRNGYLSQLHHASRGFSPQVLKVLTIIHNFDLKRSDGSTAAQRLFGQSFPDLFESILSTFTELPMPRQSYKPCQPKPLHSQPFSP